MFVDLAKVKLQAGKGGDGAVSFRHEIYIPKGGPDGGDGGRGGSIIFRADKDTNTLLAFRFNPELKAEDGKNGSGTRSAGRSGKDLIVEVPVGTQVYKLSSEKTEVLPAVRSHGELKSATPATAGGRDSAGKASVFSRILLADLTAHGQEAIIARGGDGGFGNAHFKSSTRQTPKFSELGEPGEAFTAELELKLLADVGLVGLPNAGKSTFLSVVSNARPEIADYPFTTLTPQLGVATVGDRDLLIADIPGLIEGAAEGKGLGHAFLRHIDRTAVLLHLVDVYNPDAGVAYQTVRRELEQYSDLASRPEVVALTKCEGLDQDLIELQVSAIKKINKNAKIFPISAPAHQGIKELLSALCSELECSSSLSDSGASEFAFLSNSTQTRDGVSESTREGSSVAGVTRTATSRTSLLEETSSRSAEALDENRKTKQDEYSIPTISLPKTAYKNSWTVEKLENGTFEVKGEKIEKFARRTDLSNYESVNRLRDILKKLGIRAELTNQGAEPDSLISIAGKEFTLVEDW